jgi:tetratricopeptide (TPR) repeat protein
VLSGEITGHADRFTGIRREDPLVIDRYEEFCEQQPELAARIQSIIERGRTLLENGLLQQAKKEFRRALALYPFVPAALNNLALLAFGESDSEGAKAYLEQLLKHDPHEPTACALLARYWLEMGSTPHAYRYIDTAVQAVLASTGHASEIDDSRLRRSLEFICQALIRLGDDGLLIRLYTELNEPELLPRTLLHIAIAFYNRGHFHKAVALWREVLNMAPEEVAAQIHLDMMQIIRDHKLIPFRLDHRVDMPDYKSEQRLLLVNVPTVVLGTALVHLYRGSVSEAEEALPLLVGVGLPGIHRILLELANDVTRPARLRLLAGAQLAIGGDTEAAVGVVNAIDAESCAPREEALRHLIQSLVAETRGDTAQAYQAAMQGYRLLDGHTGEPKDQAYAQILKEIASRNTPESTVQPVKEQQTDIATGKCRSNDTTASGINWPDEEWLRLALQRHLPGSLEESLANRPLEVLVETAEWLGEQNADEIEHTALIRRTAMRMRSLPLDRVLGPLSPEGRRVLAWLVEQKSPTTLAELQAWLAKQSPSVDLWQVLEELYWVSLVEIGQAVEAVLPLDASDVLVKPTFGLEERWRDGD